MTDPIEEFRHDRQRFDARCREWALWHQTNIMIWRYFERFALEAISHGRRRLSHWLIMNRIRWEVYIVTVGGEYKISNKHFAFYARYWRVRHPEHADLFRTKPMVGEPADDPRYLRHFTRRV